MRVKFFVFETYHDNNETLEQLEKRIATFCQKVNVQTVSSHRHREHMTIFFCVVQ
jgi:predicted metallo-beta-lactamase superfamily hydrolase